MPSNDQNVIVTRNVINRRKLTFRTLDEILADVDHLSGDEITALGNWSPGQVFMHLARFMDMSIDGHSPAPWLLRMVVQLLYKKRFLNKPLRAGYKLPASFQDLQPGEVETEAGIRAIRGALARLQATTERKPHPVLGELSETDWEKIHCRHAELHLSFLHRAG